IDTHGAHMSFSFYSRKALIWLLLIACVQVAITLPRFDRRDPGALQSMTSVGTANKMSDAAEYAAIVSWFRGESPREAMNVPWTYRPVVPFLASYLPLPPMTSINVINEVALLGSLFLIYGL